MSEQAQTIDLRFLAESQPSLCIPRVFNNITETKIRQVFDELGLGRISGVDIKERKNEKGDPVKRVYIHFEKWFWNENAQSARTKLISGKEIKIVYDNPWFWKVSASKWAPSHNNYEIGNQVQQTERPNTRERTVRVMSDFEEQRGGRHYERQERQERQERHYENRNNSRVDNRYEEQPRNNNDYKQRDRQTEPRYERHSENRRHLVPTLNIAPTSNVAPSLPSILKNSCPIVPKLQLKEKIVPLLEPIRKRSKHVLPLEIKVEEELEDGEIEELEELEELEIVDDVEVVVEEMSEERKELLNELYGDIKFN